VAQEVRKQTGSKRRKVKKTKKELETKKQVEIFKVPTLFELAWVATNKYVGNVIKGNYSLKMDKMMVLGGSKYQNTC